MGIYLGNVEILNTFYNFYPLYEYKDGNIVELSEADKVNLLDGSQFLNILLYYESYNEVEFMEEHFNQYTLYALDIEKSELILNLHTRTGEINKTKYKVNAKDLHAARKLRMAESLGIYRLISSQDFEDEQLFDISQLAVDINSYDLEEEEKVFLETVGNSFYAGPFESSYRSMDDRYVALTKHKENKYILSGYSKYACKVMSFNYNDDYITYVLPNNIDNVQNKDLITDTLLLDSFKTYLEDKSIVNGKIDLSAKDDLIELFESSPLMIQSDEIIRRKRLQRLVGLLEMADDVDDSIKLISERVGASLSTLISEYEDHNSAEGLISQILRVSPDLLSNISEFKVVKDSIDKLLAEKETLNHEIENLAVQRVHTPVTADTEIHNEEIDNKILEKKQELENLTLKIQEIYKTDDLQKINEELSSKNEFLQWRKEELNTQIRQLDTAIATTINNVQAKIAETYIDGFVANKVQEASAKYEESKRMEYYETLTNFYNRTETVDKTPEELVNYLYNTIKQARPQYDKNTIVNIAVSVFQNFLTVFSGVPGCGKTSICNLFGQALGLNLFEEPGKNVSRYVPISVERGWTSKRDFIGYFNPLTKKFDNNNKRVFDALQVLDIESKQKQYNHPMLMLLDEANLSPMEYYWADFMNICDDIEVANELNIGENFVFSVPETLHFMATINNDHTTETLSPRLIDRASVITLPKVKSVSFNNGILNDDTIEHISWKSIKEAFIVDHTDDIELPLHANKVYQNLKDTLEECVYVSPRIEISIRKYFTVAEKLFEQSEDTSRREPWVIALDYAVCQKILPKINGYGDDYRNWIEKLMNKCKEATLVASVDILKDILNKGDLNMKYYQFFA